MSGGSRLDHVYRSILMTKFFTKGWGKPENLKRLFAFKEKVTNREKCYRLVPRDYPVTISKEDKYSDCTILEGHFLSPFVTQLPGIVPKECEMAHFQVILPRKWNSDHYKPICLHLAGTGDHGFWRRRQMMAKPLLKESGIASVILENPFYGARKPKDQIRSSLHNVSDIIVMGGCLILESLVLFHWCENNGLGPLGVTGMSMGGHMASLAATNWPKPIVLVPCLSWSTATPVFTQGVMSHSINWELLGTQYFADDVYREEIRKYIRVDKDAFRAGQYFAKHYPYSMDHMRRLSREDPNLPQVSNSVITDKLKNRRVEQQTVGQSVANSQAVINSSNLTVTSSLESTASGSSEAHVVTSSTSIPDNFVTGVSDSSGINANVPEPESKVDKTDSNLIGKQKSSESSLLAQFSESKSRILGFRSNHSDRDASNELQNASVGKLKGPSFKYHFGRMVKIVLHINKPFLSLHSLHPYIFLYYQSLRDGLYNISQKYNIKEKMSRWREDEALLFMHGIMDECTHLRNFTVPVDTSLIIAICAKDDAYVPRDGFADLIDIWPGAEVRFLDAGHVSAYLLHKHTFRSAIIESFQRLKRKYVDL